MKNLIFTLIVIATATLASCTRDKSGLPTPQQIAAAANSAAVVTKPAVLKVDTTQYAINFLLGSQIVKTAVNNDTLKLSYTENVHLLLKPADYKASWALHLADSFSGAEVSNYNYTTITKEGNVTQNWVDDNLNNVTLKSVSDTVVNNIALVNVKVYRQFSFSKVFTNNADAVSSQAELLGRKADVITFSSWYLMPAGITSTYTGTASVVYTK